MSEQKLDVLRTCEHVYGIAQNKWDEFGIELPQRLNRTYGAAKLPEGLNARVEARYTQPGFPKVKDLDFLPRGYVPKEVREVLEKFGERDGSNARIPEDVLGIYHHWPISENNDPFGVLEVKDYYNEWFEIFKTAWYREKPSFLGWKAEVQDCSTPEGDYTFYVTEDGKVTKLSKEVPKPYEKVEYDPEFGVPKLNTVASFRAGKLTRMWQEVPNGTLFPDPKGEMDTIWPVWVSGTDPIYMSWSGSEYDWNNYLERIREGEPVTSGRTFNFVHQTERQARDNLARWREYIYQKYPQVFYFRTTSEDPFFTSVGGYKSYGKWGSFIVKNETSYRELEWNQVRDRLLNWKP